MDTQQNLPLQAGCYYHVYNRGNNRENIFYKSENYRYFLVKFDEFLSPYLDTYAYCLLPNHFHFLVRIKDELPALPTGQTTHTNPGKIVSEAFRRFFTAYSKAINKQEGRTGSLFQKNFKRRAVTNEHYFSRLICYIHTNPRKHQIYDDYQTYPHSSYRRILIDKPTKLAKKEVISWYGSKSDFIHFHSQMHDYIDLNHLIIEDE